VDCTVVLPGGETLTGQAPIVVIGPNGSGKTRQTREIQAPGRTIEFINALRNTRVAPELPAWAWTPLAITSWRRRISHGLNIGN
jgi:hypothetical protein